LRRTAKQPPAHYIGATRRRPAATGQSRSLKRKPPGRQKAPPAKPGTAAEQKQTLPAAAETRHNRQTQTRPETKPAQAPSRPISLCLLPAIAFLAGKGKTRLTVFSITRSFLCTSADKAALFALLLLTFCQLP